MAFKKKHIIYIIAAASISVVFGGVAAYSLVKYTTSEKHFCMSCHRDQGSSDFSRQSALHPRYISCDECHADNSDIIPTGFNASPELVNKNCIRCHTEIQSTNDWKELKTNIQEIRIEHEKHLKTVGLNCVDCHNNIAHDSTPVSTNRPHMSRCFGCHASRKEGCGTCHPSGFVEIEKLDDISVAACSKCHMDFLRKERGRVEGFLHKKHLISLLECSTCHDINAQHPVSTIEEGDCGSCHHRKTGKRCEDCHAVQNQMYLGIRDAEWPYPDVMATAGMSCNIGCHVDLNDGHSFKSVKEACITCHEEEYGKSVEEFKAALNKSIERLKELVSDIKTEAEGRAGTEKIQADIEYSEKELDFVERAKGVHNMPYTLLIISDVEKRLRDLHNRILVKQQ